MTRYWLYTLLIALVISDAILVYKSQYIWLNALAIAVTLLAIYVARKRSLHAASNPLPLPSRKSCHKIAINTLIILFVVLSVQFIAKVYAMTFSVGSQSSETNSTSDVVLGDFDGDGDLDYIAGNTDADFDIYRNDGAGTFTHVGTIAGIYSGFKKFVAADVDGDGDLDLVYGRGGASQTVGVFRNDGNLSFSSSYSYAYNSESADVNDVAVVDVENDGDLDIVVATSAVVTKAVHLNDRHGNFTAANSTLHVAEGIIPGDFNSDGVSDLFLTSNGNDTTYVYVNSGTGAFIELSNYTSPDNVHNPSIMDADADGDLDILFYSGPPGAVEMWLNNGNGTFSTQVYTSTIQNGGGNDLTTADFDNDGNVDFFTVGDSDAELWLNDGNGSSFTNNWQGTPITNPSSIAVGDLDGDGILDYVLGKNATTANAVYLGAATSPNTAPTASSTFTGAKISDNGSIATVRLSWGSGSDTETATKLLQYQIKVGTGSNTNNIVSGATSSPSWVTRLMPNGQSRTYLLNNLPCNNTFYWNVATVDTGFRTTWGTEQSFTLDGSCNYSAGGGGGEASPELGGGWSWNYLHQANSPSAPEPSEKAQLTVQAFNDITGNGLHESRETTTGFKNLPVTIHGVTDDGNTIERTVAMDEKGMISVKIRSGTYTLTVDSGSSVVKNKTPTTSIVFEDVTVLPGEIRALEVGFQDTALLRHKPCTTVSPEDTKEGSDAEALLRRLVNNFGQKVVTGVSLSEPLVTRRTFFTLLTTMHCVDLSESEASLKQRLRETFALGTIPGWTSIELRDLPLAPLSSNARMVYTLLADGVPVVRSSTNGPLADLQSPISRSDAVRIVSAIMQIPDDKRVIEGILPFDLDATNPILSDLFTLQHFKILPQSFFPVFGPQQGMNLREAAHLLDLSAFSAGRINLLGDFHTNGIMQNENFLERELPNLALSTSVFKDVQRAYNVSFSNIVPEDSLYQDLRSALAFGTKNRANETLWLIPGTARTTEFGVEKGQTTLNPDEPATLLETLRSLLVLSGLPPPTRAEVVSGAAMQESEASEEHRVTQDLLTNSPRDESFASRVLYRVQDSVRAYNLSLVSFTPWLLHHNFASSSSVLSIEDAADLFASTLIRNAVMQGDVRSENGDSKMQSLRQSISEYLLGTSLTWKTDNIAKNVVFTKRMLTHLLGTIVQTASNGMHQDFTSEESPGMAWWLRLR